MKQSTFNKAVVNAMLRTLEDLMENEEFMARPALYYRAMRLLNQEIVHEALKQKKGNITQAQNALGVSRTTLSKWLDQNVFDWRAQHLEQ